MNETEPWAIVQRQKRLFCPYFASPHPNLASSPVQKMERNFTGPTGTHTNTASMAAAASFPSVVASSCTEAPSLVDLPTNTSIKPRGQHPNCTNTAGQSAYAHGSTRNKAEQELPSTSRCGSLFFSTNGSFQVENKTAVFLGTTNYKWKWFAPVK